MNFTVREHAKKLTFLQASWGEIWPTPSQLETTESTSSNLDGIVTMSPLVQPLVLMIGLVLDGCGPVAQAQEKMTKIPEHLYSSPPLRSEEIPPPAPVSGQDRRQLDQAVAAGSSAALVMFLSRYPDSPLAAEARADLKSRVKPDPAGVTRQVAESDAEVVMAFDSARLSGDPAQVSAFIARYAPHPLTKEASHLPY